MALIAVGKFKNVETGGQPCDHVAAIEGRESLLRMWSAAYAAIGDHRDVGQRGAILGQHTSLDFAPGLKHEIDIGAIIPIYGNCCCILQANCIFVILGSGIAFGLVVDGEAIEPRWQQAKAIVPRAVGRDALLRVNSISPTGTPL